MPDGKRNFSWLIMLRFMGMASATPNSARKKVQPASTGHGKCCPCGFCAVTLSSSSAGVADTIVLPVE